MKLHKIHKIENRKDKKFVKSPFSWIAKFVKLPKVCVLTCFFKVEAVVKAEPQ